MGTFSTTIEIGNLDGGHYETMEALADTGATTTVVPRCILDGLGIIPTRQETFEYASGERVELDMAAARGREWKGETPILGSSLARMMLLQYSALIRWRACSSPLIRTTNG